MFKHPADRIPVLVILSISLIDFVLYFCTDNALWLGAYFVVMLVPKGKICAWNHHHQHTPTFKKDGLNRLLEFFYALHTGVTTNLWVLHHVLGHHKNYLDQSKDESRWRRKTGTTMGEIEYTLNVAATAYYRGYQVGKQFPRIQRAFIIFGALTFILLAALLYFNPIAALFLFVLPMICGLVLTSWATYDHHSDLDTANPFEASRNNLHWFFNLTTGNLGYHTAHHYRQGLHWSLLPKLHEQIKENIPKELIKSAPL